MSDLSKEESWKTLSKKEYCRNKHFTIAEEKFVTPKKTEGTYYVVENFTGSKIIALDGDDMLLIEEYRYPIAKRIVDLPGGGVEEGETPEITAKRELLEEIGATAQSWMDCGYVNTLPGFIRSKCHVFIAKDLTFVGERKLDDTETDSTVLKKTKKEVYEMLDNGEIENALSAATLLKARKYMDL